MKSKTSITLSEEVMRELDRAAGGESRSAFIERVLRGYFRRRARMEINVRDRAILDREADSLNAEAEDAMTYQSWPDDSRALGGTIPP